MRSCLIADDHILMREALAGTVRLAWREARITQVGDFPAAWTSAAASQPDVALVDLMMPGATPLAGVAGVRRAAPATAILVITGTDDDRLMLDLLDLGISGFATKTASGSVIEAALRLVVAGGRYLPPRLAQIAASRSDLMLPNPRSLPALTLRQREVLRLVARGLSNKEIANALDLAPETVKNSSRPGADRSRSEESHRRRDARPGVPLTSTSLVLTNSRVRFCVQCRWDDRAASVCCRRGGSHEHAEPFCAGMMMATCGRGCASCGCSADVLLSATAHSASSRWPHDQPQEDAATIPRGRPDGASSEGTTARRGRAGTGSRAGAAQPALEP